ncbi:MAG: hypothetical protein V1853_01015 [bacterium]
MKNMSEHIPLGLRGEVDVGQGCRNCGKTLKALPVFVPDSPKPFYCTDCQRVEFRD